MPWHSSPKFGRLSESRRQNFVRKKEKSFTKIKVSHFPADKHPRGALMELTPIPGIQPDYTPVKAPAADFQLSSVVNMEVVVRTDHSARPAPRKKAADAEEAEAEDQAPASENAETVEDPSEPHISFFA
jgi:hypothetical protein